MHITTRTLSMILLLCSGTLIVQAGSYYQESQNTTEAKGSITGRVTVDGKPAPGIILILKKHESGLKKTFELTLQPSSGLKATTDDEGIFRFNDVPVGRYEIEPFALALISPPAGKSSKNRSTASDSETKLPEEISVITVTEGKIIEGIDFALSRGGVITGMVTDAEGRPVIREAMTLTGADDSANAHPWLSENLAMIMTDDRGVYRLYGIPPGRYVVAIGGSPMAALTPRRNLPRTYYPGTTDRTKAKVVEVTQGGETIGIDIKIPATAKGLYAAGRIIDEAGKPVGNLFVMYSQTGSVGETPSYYPNYTASNAKGEFKFENIKPGKYRVSIMGQPGGIQNEFYSDGITMEVKNEDVTGLEIKLRRGSSISGTAVIEGATDPEMISRLAQLYLGASVMGGDGRAPGFASGKISPDGSFRISGLSPGKASIAVFGITGSSEFKLSRVEINGVEVSNDVDIKEGDHITGARLIFVVAKGVIRGKVVISGGKLPANAYLQVRLYKSGTSEPANSSWNDEVEIDADGNFVIDGLAAGSYDIEVSAEREDSASGNTSQLGTTRQSVIVTNDAPAEAVITLEIKKGD